MHWHVIHTKPRQEERALLNLERQGYACYLPMLAVERLRKGAVIIVEEPLFPRYLFIHLETDVTGKGWGPIRSTKGVSALVTFGAEPARVDDTLIEALRAQSDVADGEPRRLFTPGERLMITGGAFAGIEAVYEMADGESRAFVLIELLRKATKVRVAAGRLRKIG
jgi:transcriptional antiterminator RfaH